MHTVVYEIKSLEPEPTTRQSGEVAVDAADRESATTRDSTDVPVDAADRESALIPLAPLNEIRGGSSAMQAFAVVCAAMVASTLLQHTALRGVIESERLDRLYRVWSKNRYLVSRSLSAHRDSSVLFLKSVFDLNENF